MITFGKLDGNMKKERHEEETREIEIEEERERSYREKEREWRKRETERVRDSGERGTDDIRERKFCLKSAIQR